MIDAAPQPGTEAKAWAIEMSSPGVFDAIRLKFAPLRNGDAGGIFMQATLADGRVMTYSVGLQEG